MTVGRRTDAGPTTGRKRVVLRALKGQALSGWIALVGVSVRASARS